MNAHFELMLGQAIQNFQSGNLDSAKNILTRLLQVDKNLFPALYILGLIEASNDNHTQAVQLLKRAVAIDPNDASLQYNLAKALSSSDGHLEAIKHHKKAIQLAPGNPEAWLNYGDSLFKLKRYTESLEALNKCLEINPHYPEALLSKAACLNTLKLYEEGLRFSNLALEINPNLTNALWNKANSLEGLKRYQEALDIVDEVILKKPSNLPDALKSKGNLLKDLKAYDKALAHFNGMLLLDPHKAETWSNKGSILIALKKIEEAVSHFDKAIELEPSNVIGWYNKGVALDLLKRHDEALQQYNQAISIDPNYNLAVWNKALSQLVVGNYREGFSNYEAREKLESGMLPTTYNSIPKLSNLNNLEGRSILIWCEQGIGDTFQFCRYIPLLKEMGARITFVTPKPLLEIIDTLEGVDNLITEVTESFSQFDFQTPLLSLPHIFRTTIESIPKDVPYLQSTPAKEAFWKDKLKQSHRFKVGLVWNGGFRKDQPELWELNERRNIPLEKFATIKDVPGIDFFSLQKGDPAESELLLKKPQIWPENNLFNFTSELQDFSDTAALIQQLDLIISVDTSTAHLAGALGKPVWILNRYDSCWRWLYGRTDSPWYPSAKLYNQDSFDNWNEVLVSVKTDLQKISQNFIR